MEREYFTFYKSFYDAIKDLPNDIKLEVLTAIAEYGLYGEAPKDMKPFTKSIFTLIKPNMDASSVRYENGRKGGRPKSTGKKTASQQPKPQPTDDYTFSYEQEIEVLRKDEEWIEGICHDYSLFAGDVCEKHLDAFLKTCRKRTKKQHDSLDDCKSHFRYWMDKTQKATQDNQPLTPPAPTDYTFVGGFGGTDI